MHFVTNFYFMRVVMSKRISKLLMNKKKARILLRQLVENDKLDGMPIKTDFGNFTKA